jgi:hypothetical protein
MISYMKLPHWASHRLSAPRPDSVEFAAGGPPGCPKVGSSEGPPLNAFTGTEGHKTHIRPSQIVLILRGFAESRPRPRSR